MLTAAQLWAQMLLQLTNTLQQLPPASATPGVGSETAVAGRQVVLALSGGLDSMLLLALLCHLRSEQPLQLQAVHVCHQLQSVAADWVEFCRAQCAARQVRFTDLTVQLTDPLRNIEQQARTLRYQALATQLKSGGVLMTAHHADDQLETLLLALKRGAGLTGLAGIASCQSFDAGYLLRPLLPFSRQQLETVAHWLGLPYVEDPSNQDVSFDRNFLRQQIIPLLSARFPAISQTASRSAGLLQQSLAFQQQQLAARLTQLCCADGALALEHLMAIAQPEQDLLLHYYLQRAGVQLSMLQLQQVRQMFLTCRHDAQPEFRLAGKRLRRYDQLLYVDDINQLPQPPLDSDIPFGCQRDWPALQLSLFWGAQPRQGWLALPLAVPQEAALTLSFGQLNRRFTPAGQVMSRALKDWCKRWKVPPWQRGILPFVIAGQQKELVHAVLHREQILSQYNTAQAESWLNVRWHTPEYGSGADHLGEGSV